MIYMEIIDQSISRDSIRLSLLEKTSESESKFKDMLDKLGICYYREYPFYKDRDPKVVRDKSYYVDFLIKDYNVIIELDGQEHKRYNDYDRDYELFMEGYYVYRLRNEDIEEKGMDFILRISKLHNIPLSNKVYRTYITWYKNTAVADSPIYMTYRLMSDGEIIHEGFSKSDYGSYALAIRRCVYSSIHRIEGKCTLEYCASTDVSMKKTNYDEDIRDKICSLSEDKQILIAYVNPDVVEKKILKDMNIKMKKHFGL